MGLFTGKKGVVFGIANDRSIAWAITQKLAEEGAEIGFTHLPDNDERRKNEKKVRKLVDPINASFLVPCNVTQDEDLDMRRFEAIGVIRNQPVFNEEQLQMFTSGVEALRAVPVLDKAAIKELIFKVLPEFAHKETGKYLDQKM